MAIWHGVWSCPGKFLSVKDQGRGTLFFSRTIEKFNTVLVRLSNKRTVFVQPSRLDVEGKTGVDSCESSRF